jgi:glycosyltransferase involved in cell wall biosynthesis
MKELTVIIPCLNEEKFIEKTLQSIIHSDFNKDKLKILIYDGNSEDSSVEIINKYVEKFNYISLRINNERIAPVAFNQGIKEADTEFVMILGAHSEVATNYFTKCIDFLQNNKNYDVVGGVLKNKGVDRISDSIAIAMSSPFGVGGAHFRTGVKSGEVTTVAFGVYRKSIFDKVGLFNERLVRGQDGEMNHRIIKSAGKIYLLNDTKAIYYVRSSFKKLFKQYFQYGYWKFILNVINKSFVSLRQIVPSLFITLIVLTIFSWIYSKPIFILCLCFLTLYFSMGIYQGIRLSKSWIKRFNIFLGFMVLHISYGIGYFAGIGSVIFKQNGKSRK